jgi:hypothetical protein
MRSSDDRKVERNHDDARQAAPTAEADLLDLHVWKDGGAA